MVGASPAGPFVGSDSASVAVFWLCSEFAAAASSLSWASAARFAMAGLPRCGSDGTESAVTS